MNAIETLISVLCDPEGKCCISGSDDDRRLIDSALAELEAQLEAEIAGGVQALSAAPVAFLKSVIALCSHRGYSPANIEAWDKDDKWIADLWRQAESMLTTSPTPPAEQQAAPKAAPGVGNSGFDHKTAADFLNNKIVSDEAVRNFVAASRWAHDERAALSATLLAMHGVLTSREAEIALLKKALLEAEAAPQQEAQEPVAYVEVSQSDAEVSMTWGPEPAGFNLPTGRYALYTTPQPSPAPLSECLRLLNSFEYEGDEDSQAKAFFKAHINEDWFFHVKNSLELAIAAQGGKDA